MNFEDRINNPWANAALQNRSLIQPSFGTHEMASYDDAVSPNISRNPITKSLVRIPKGQPALNPIGTLGNTYREYKQVDNPEGYANSYKLNPNFQQWLSYMKMRGPM